MPRASPCHPFSLSTAGGTSPGRQETWARSGLGAVALGSPVSCSVLCQSPPWALALHSSSSPSLRAGSDTREQVGICGNNEYPSMSPGRPGRRNWAPASMFRGDPRGQLRVRRASSDYVVPRGNGFLNTPHPHPRHRPSFGQQGLLGLELSSVFKGPGVMSERFPKFCAPETLVHAG